MKIIVVSSCTGRKAVNAEAPLRESDFRLVHEPEAFSAREAAAGARRLPAEEMYTGQQHLRLMRGVRLARASGLSVAVRIVSAGYGLIPGGREIVPYDLTFQGMPAGRAAEWAAHLRIPERFREVAAEPADLLLVALGEGYLTSLGLDGTCRFAAPALFLTGRGGERAARAAGAVRVAALGKEETRHFSCGQVGLKGEVAGRLLAALAEGARPEALLAGAEDGRLLAGLRARGANA